MFANCMHEQFTKSDQTPFQRHEMNPFEPKHCFIQIDSNTDQFAVKFTRDYPTLIKRILCQIQDIYKIERTDILAFRYNKSHLLDTEDLCKISCRSDALLLNCVISKLSLEELTKKAKTNEEFLLKFAWKMNAVLDDFIHRWMILQID